MDRLLAELETTTAEDDELFEDPAPPPILKVGPDPGTGRWGAGQGQGLGLGLGLGVVQARGWGLGVLGLGLGVESVVVGLNVGVAARMLVFQKDREQPA